MIDRVRAAIAALARDHHRRQYAATYMRRMLLAHPKARAFAEATSRRRVVCANRRAAKTSTAGMESGARVVERDDYRVWVLAADLSEYARNWIQRPGHGLIEMLIAAGLKRGKEPDVEALKADFFAHRGSHGWVRRVGFSWKSSIEIFSDPSDARGGAPNLLIVDEAQKAEDAAEAILAVVAPAALERKCEVWLSGTPGHAIDSLFGRASQDPAAGWDRHVWFSWDNPKFGDTFAERIGNLRGELREWGIDYGITPEQWRYLDSLTEETITGVLEHPVGKTIHEHVLREWFGVWVRERAQMVYAVGSPGAEAPYWAVEHEGSSRMARGMGLADDMLAAAGAIPARVAELTSQVGSGLRAQVGIDLGYEDPFAIVALASVGGVGTRYELASAKAPHLPEHVQIEVINAFLSALRQAVVPVDVVVADTGGSGKASVETWTQKVRARFGVTIMPAEKWPGSVEQTVMLVNADTYAGRILYRRGSPLDVELRHLQWKYPEEGKKGQREQDKKRSVTFPDGSKGVPGNHCADALRYLLVWMSVEREEPAREPRTSLAHGLIM